MLPKNLLLIESNQGDALLIKMALQHINFHNQIKTIESLEEGFDLLINSGAFSQVMVPDFILLGFSLPNTEWLDFLRLLKRHPKFQSVPVIVLADSCAARNEPECLKLGAERVIIKPLFLEDYYPKFSFLNQQRQNNMALKAIAC